MSLRLPILLESNQLTSVIDTWQFLSTILPILPAFSSLSFNNTAALAASVCTSLSISAFFFSCSVASPLDFLIWPISFCNMLSCLRVLSCSYWTEGRRQYAQVIEAGRHRSERRASALGIKMMLGGMTSY